MYQTVFRIAQMDCSSEEHLVRSQLQGMKGIVKLEFDIHGRTLKIIHEEGVDEIEQAIHALRLGAKKVSTEPCDDTGHLDRNGRQKTLLLTVLMINFAFFLIEMITGIISGSMGLIADSLDMLADGFVYGISLLAVGGSLVAKKRAAAFAGYFQITLALIGFVAVFRRFFSLDPLPDYAMMIYISAFALVANIICLILLNRSDGKQEAHIKASLIFTSNDVIINAGVIMTGLLVHWLQSGLPDLIIGTIIFIIVIRGALKILKLSR